MSVADARIAELEEIEERLEEQIEAIKEQLGEVTSQVENIDWEMDDYLAEYNFTQVKQSIEIFNGLIDDDVIADLTLLTTLGEIRHGPQRGKAPHVGDIQSLRLEDLPEIETDDPDVPAWQGLQNRVSRCSDHIRSLFNQFEDEWSSLISEAEFGNASTMRNRLMKVQSLIEETSNAYKLWEISLSALYEESPTSLGRAGGEINAVKKWLASS